MELTQHCYAEISLPAFRANVRHAKKTLAGKAKLMIAVKSEAYGHGGLTLAHAAREAGADALAVLDIAQGIQIRAAEPDIPLLCWLHSPTSDFGGAARAGLDLGISGTWQLDLLVAQAPGMNTRVHLKIDTGLHRNGALAKQWPDLVRHAAAIEADGHITVVGIWSHLADTSLEEDNASLQRFHDAVEIARAAGLTPSLLHIAASAAAADVPEARLDMVRVGIIAYGVSPFGDRTAQELGFQPVMSVRAQVVSHSPRGDTATLGMGFGDGLLPPHAGRGWVTYAGVRYPIESVEADHLIIGSAADVALPPVGEWITLWGDSRGESPRAEDWAEWADTIGDEVVSSLGAHVQRKVIDEN
ncbi:MAG: alanine racemase [Pontimonas sp.]|nr:alanine racemase [Pontimonas sp.]